jgi:hypothetical protein
MKNKHISFLAIAFFLHCAVSGKGEVLDPGREVPSQSDLPVKSIDWDLDKDGAYQFYTNDTSRKGFLYYYTVTGGTQTPMTSFEIQAKKKSGEDSYGYGMMFCSQGGSNYYLFQISENGYYYVGKYVNGTYSNVVSWVANSSIVKGANNYNTLKVVYTGSNTFEFWINGTKVNTKTDSSFTGGAMGFALSVASTDDFPNTPVDARFLKIAP